MKIFIATIFLAAFAYGCTTKPEKQNHAAPAVQKHFPNPLMNKKFHTEKLIGLSVDDSDHTLVDAKQAGEWVGNTIRFKDNIHFVSAYEAWCGNDCFTTVFGRYYFVDSLKVRFYTDSIAHSGECEAPMEYTKYRPGLDLYLVKEPDGQLQLNHKPIQLKN